MVSATSFVPPSIPVCSSVYESLPSPLPCRLPEPIAWIKVSAITPTPLATADPAATVAPTIPDASCRSFGGFANSAFFPAVNAFATPSAKLPSC